MGSWEYFLRAVSTSGEEPALQTVGNIGGLWEKQNSIPAKKKFEFMLLLWDLL
jgi:hypothetical protein